MPPRSASPLTSLSLLPEFYPRASLRGGGGRGVTVGDGFNVHGAIYDTRFSVVKKKCSLFGAPSAAVIVVSKGTGWVEGRLLVTVSLTGFPYLGHNQHTKVLGDRIGCVCVTPEPRWAGEIRVWRITSVNHLFTHFGKAGPFHSG